jgi:hypothetical protein
VIRFLRWLFARASLAVAAPDRTFGARIIEHPDWQVVYLRARTAWDNRRDQSRIRVTVFDNGAGFDGAGLPGVPVSFDTVPSQGMAYEHKNVYGVTADGEHYPKGYLELHYAPIYGAGGDFDVYVAGCHLVTGLTTIAVPNEYPELNGVVTSWRPTSGRGTVSWDVGVAQKKRSE